MGTHSKDLRPLSPSASEEEEILEATETILKGFRGSKEELIPILQRLQKGLGYIPEPAIRMVSERIGVPPGEVLGVVTFYNQFRLNPPGRYRIKVCMGTACHVKRSYIIMEEWERRLGIKEGETTPDRMFSLERVACVGCCALAPVAVVENKGKERFYGYMMTSKVNGMILEFEREKEREGE